MNLMKVFEVALLCSVFSCGHREQNTTTQEQPVASASLIPAATQRPAILSSGLGALRVQLNQLGVPFHAGTVGDSRAILHGTTEDKGTTVTLIGDGDTLLCATISIDARASKQALGVSAAIERALMTAVGWPQGLTWASGFTSKTHPGDQRVGGVHWHADPSLGVLQIDATPEIQPGNMCKP